jgi:membrane-bound lytic murein transglycosylase D
MFRFLFLVVLLLQSAYAFLSIDSNYQEQVKVLRSLDINPTFLADSVFMSMKENVDSYRTNHFLKVLENGNRFIPILRNMLSEAGVPDAFLYLAMAESNFSPRAYSSARASGIWQFMSYTAERFGLTIDSYVDERRDPVKSTEAAIKYLKFLHDKFGKWYLAAIAYNCGEGCLGRAISVAGTDDLSVLLDSSKRYIPRESRLYIRKIVMLEYISTSTDFIVGNGSEYLLNSGNTDTFEMVSVHGGTTLSAVADSIGMSDKELIAYNSHLKYGFVPPGKGEYNLYLPYGKRKLFEKNFDLKQDNGRFYVHRIKQGDSLSALGREYGVSYQMIIDFNKLKTNLLSINQKLIIPVVKPRTKSYTIKSGDTINGISKKFNVEMAIIMKINNKKSSMIMPGERLVIPNIF